MEHRFDELAKRLAGGGSRRQALRWMGGLFGGLVGLVGMGKARADAQAPGAVRQAVDTICNAICHGCFGDDDTREDECERACTTFANSTIKAHSKGGTAGQACFNVT